MTAPVSASLLGEVPFRSACSFGSPSMSGMRMPSVFFGVGSGVWTKGAGTRPGVDFATTFCGLATGGGEMTIALGVVHAVRDNPTLSTARVCSLRLRKKWGTGTDQSLSRTHAQGGTARQTRSILRAFSEFCVLVAFAALANLALWQAHSV